MNTYQITIQTDSNLTVATVSWNEELATYKWTKRKTQESALKDFEVCATNMRRNNDGELRSKELDAVFAAPIFDARKAEEIIMRPLQPLDCGKTEVEK